MEVETRRRDPTDDQDWIDVASRFRICPGTTYLNHGSFGIAPDAVRYARRGLINRLDENPMKFFVRDLEELMFEAREKLAAFVGTEAANLVYVDNATYAMNVVADSFPLDRGDEVLVNDHEYGAVHRIWERRCNATGAQKITVELPDRFDSPQTLVESLLDHVTDRTRLLVISHITSPTALILPITEITASFKQRGVAVCVDGPHALAQIDFRIDELHCDFYTASCHKWLCGTLGSGFLFADPQWHSHMRPIMKSWGRLLPAMPEQWDDEFTWLGTRDPAAFLSVPVAIDFMEQVGLDAFRARSHWLANYAEQQLQNLFQTQPLGKREGGWYGSMAHVPLPPGDWSRLQQRLWEETGIEIPVIQFKNRWFIRVSCHLYNNTVQIDTLILALQRFCTD